MSAAIAALRCKKDVIIRGAQAVAKSYPGFWEDFRMLGGRAQTFSGLSGVGDLIVTCMSRHSRNRYVGEELGKGRGIDEIIRSMGMVVAEGVKTSESMCQLARKIGVETPVANTIYDIIYHGKSPKDAVLELMTRKAKHETE